MRHLFRCNQPTRMDTLVHLSLGLAALVAICCSLGTAFDFCARLDQIADWFMAPSPVVSAPGDGKRISLTNATGIEVPALEDAGTGLQTNLPAFAPAAEREVGCPASG